MMLKLRHRLLSMSLVPRKYLPSAEASDAPVRIEDTLEFLVKVCGITNEQDAAIALEAGANAIGFHFYPRSPRCIDVTQARRIVQAVRGPYLKVGVFVNPTEDELLETAAQIPLNVLQLHGDSAPFHLAKSLSVWQAIAPDAIPKPLSRDISAWLMDSAPAHPGSSDRPFEWAMASNFPGRAIIAGGIEATNVISAIEIARPWGVDACSRLESRPGQKDHERVKDFVQAALAGFRLRQMAS